MPNRPRYFSSDQAVLGTQGLEALISRSETVDIAEAIFKGQASDGGLFIPDHFPFVDPEIIKQMRNWSYPDIFVEVMNPFFEDTLARKTLERIAKEAYTFKPFAEKISDIDFIVRLDEGPTAAFKDYAAQVLFRFTEALVKEPIGNRLKAFDLLTYIVATSGDTGGAMGVACHGREKMWMVILHSSRVPAEISELQAKQMDTLGENIYVIRVDTDFDGCQALASRLQKDLDLKYMNMTSANSVNIGRLLPQIAYYFYAYSRTAEPNEEIHISVPSGNFGNAVAGLFARRMGLPIRLIIAVNENDVFERFYGTGVYRPASETSVCPSSAMDVNKPSNMRRLFQLYGGQLIGDSNTTIVPDMKRLREELTAYSISSEETYRLVQEFYEQNHKIGDLHSTIEPHGAVAWGAAQRFRQAGYNGKTITFETAHPGKFPESLKKIGIEPVLPECLAKLVDIPHGRFYVTKNDYGAIKLLLINLYQQELSRQRV